MHTQTYLLDKEVSIEHGHVHAVNDGPKPVLLHHLLEVADEHVLPGGGVVPVLQVRDDTLSLCEDGTVIGLRDHVGLQDTPTTGTFATAWGGRVVDYIGQRSRGLSYSD